MPYRWTSQPDTGTGTQTGPKPGTVWHLTLWPYRSLSPEGFVTFFGITFLALMVPMIAVLGSPILWGLLPFAMGALALTWAMVRRNQTDRSLREDLVLTRDSVTLTRHNPRSPDQNWQANPYWLRVEMHATGGPVENYLTLTGGGRTVEIGAFLSPGERAALHEELTRRLARLGPAPH